MVCREGLCGVSARCVPGVGMLCASAGLASAARRPLPSLPVGYPPHINSHQRVSPVTACPAHWSAGRLARQLDRLAETDQDRR